MNRSEELLTVVDSTRRRMDCIFCGQRADSKEHLLPAAIGGRRQQTGILCHECNARFSKLDEALSRQLAFFGYLIGMRADRRPLPREGKGRDPRLKRHYRIDTDGGLRLMTPEVSIQPTPTGGAFIRALGSEADILKIARTFRSAEPDDGHSTAEMDYVPIEMRHRIPYRSKALRRATARIALNYLAHFEPDLARAESLLTVKRFIRTGREDSWSSVAWEDFGHDVTGLRPRGPFVHRVVLMLPALNGLAYCRVTLLGGYTVTVSLGPLVAVTRTRVVDSDPLKDLPDDTSVRVVRVPMHAPRRRPFPKVAVEYQMRVLFLRARLFQWDRQSGPFVSEINQMRGVPRRDRPRLLTDLLNRHMARLVSVLRAALDYSNLWYPRGLKREAIARLRRLVAAARGHQYELAPRTYQLALELRDRLSTLLSDKLVYRSLRPL
jgi:HNH endonuclease